MSNGNSNNLETFYLNAPDQLPAQGNGVNLNFIVDVEEGSLIDFNTFTLQNATSNSGIYYLNIIFGHTDESLPTGRHEFNMPIPAQNLYNSGTPIVFYVISYNDGTGNDRRKTMATVVNATP